MNVMSLILVLCLYPFVLLMYFLLKNDATPKKNMHFGVTLAKEQRNASEVKQIAKNYESQMKKLLGILMLIPIPIIIIPWFSIALTFWMIWLLATCFVFFIPFGIANRRLKELKLEKGWKINQEQPLYVEIKAAGRVRRVKWYDFLLQNVLSLGFLIWVFAFYQGTGATIMRILISTFGTITPLFWLMAVWMDKQKTQIISMDSDVNVNYNRAKKNLWKNFWVSCSWANVIYMVSTLFSLDQSGILTSVFWIATLLYTVITIVLLFWLMKKKKDVDASYHAKMDVTFTDDDDHWIWGMFYYNPKDKHSMVENRVGIGTTVNMATPAGKGFAIFGCASLLLLPAICIWVIMLEFTPIRLVIEDNQVVACHLKEDYTISLDSIQNVELLSDLPKMSKNYGTSINTLKKGSFLIAEEGRCTVFLNPQNEVFIKLQSYGETYYISGFDDKETKQVYEALK